MSGVNPPGNISRWDQQPDPDLGMAGLQLEMAQNIRSDEARSTPGSTGKARPSVPQKRNHVEELVRLRKDLEVMTQERDQAIAQRDAMADDMLKLDEEKDEKDLQLKKMSREVWDLRDKVERLSQSKPDAKRPIVPSKPSYAIAPVARDSIDKLESELTQAQKEIQKLTVALADSEAALAEAEKSLEARTRTSDTNARTEAELAQARQQVQELATALARSQLALEDAKLALVESKATTVGSAIASDVRSLPSAPNEAESLWRSQLQEQQRLREAAESSLQNAKDSHEIQMKEVRRKHKEQKRELEKAESELQTHSERMDIDSTDTEELGRLRSLVTQREGTIMEERKRAEQFRRMSERLTTQVKQATMAQRNAEQLEQAAKRQLESIKPRGYPSQPRQGTVHMPGSFS